MSRFHLIYDIIFMPKSARVMQTKTKQLKEFLLDSGLIKKADLDAAFKNNKKQNLKPGEYLIKKGLISPEQLAKVYAYLLGVPFVNLEKEKIDQSILKIIPEAIAKKHNIIAYKKDGKQIEVAMLDPENLQAIELIVKKTGLKVLARLTSPNSIKEAIKQYQKTLESELKELSGLPDKKLKIIADSEKNSLEDPQKAAAALPIIKIVDTLLKHAILQEASDIHIEPQEKQVVVRYRIDGILKESMVLPREVYSGVVARVKVLANLKLDEHRLPQDGRFKIETEAYRISFRVSILPAMDGEKIVMRLLPEESRGLTLENLGFYGENLEKVHRNISRPHGMILVTGPTGSGKTTTLYTILDILNQSSVNITTIEDPIEYKMKGVTQSQVKPKIGYTFANGLRSLVRQDPDIIMVGEIRDNETASIAVNAALTGHLLLSTLHTNDAATSVPRLRDMGVEAFLISSTLNLIIAQRLVRRLCQENALPEKYRLSEKEILSLKKQFNLDNILHYLQTQKIIKKEVGWKDIEFYQPHNKCNKCNEGYKGRLGIYEVLEVTDSIKSLINNQATAQEISNKAQSEGMATMAQDGFLKAIQGLTSIDEILRVTRE